MRSPHAVQAILVVGGMIAVAGCREGATAPGACPEFCPPEAIELIDSVFTQGIGSDSTFTGFVSAHEASGMQLVNDPAGANGIATSRAVLRFLAFPERVLIEAGDTTTGPVLAVDSFGVRLSIVARDSTASGLELAVHRLPTSVDTTTTFASLDAYFADSTLLAVVPIPDTLTAGAVETALAADAFPTFDANGRRGAVGVVLRSAAPTSVVLGTLEAGSGAQLSRYVQVQSSGGPVARSEARLPALDTYVAPPLASPAVDVLRVGGVPAARAVLRLNLPSLVIDSSEVVRGTLILVPTEPAIGAPGDSAIVIAQGVTADVGAKSPLVVIPSDSLLFRITSVRVGAADTVRIDITDLLLGFRTKHDRPRVIVIRIIPEGASFAEIRLGSTARAAARPVIRVTYLPPVDLGFR